MLHFEGSNGDTETTDDIVIRQDIRFNGKTADKTSLADYSEFGCDVRSVGSAVEYGQQGVVGTGQGTKLRLVSINFNHVGARGDISNDYRSAKKAQEVVNTDGNAQIAYVSIDELGDFRVGDAFRVNQRTGEVTFQNTTTDLTSLNSLTITDGVNNSIITPTSGRFGEILISGNDVESVTGDLNLLAAGGGSINIIGDTNVIGVLTAQVIEINAIQRGDTSIALDDTGTDGTIRFNTDNAEAMRIDNQQRVGIKTIAPRADLDVLGQSQLDNLVVTGVTTTDLVSAASTIGFATITEAGVGILTVTGISTFVGEARFLSDVTIDADLTVSGSQNATAFGAQFLNITGFATITQLGVTTAAGIASAIIGVEQVGISTIQLADIVDAGVGVATISVADITDAGVGVATIGDADVTFADIDDLNVGVATVGVLTVTGLVNLQSDVYVAGDLNVTGDIKYDEVTGRNLNITGIATIGDLEVVGTSTVGVLSTKAALIGIVTAGIVTARDGFFETLTFGSGGGGGGGEGSGTGINSESVTTGNLNITGIATINSGFATDFTIERLDVSNNAEIAVGVITDLSAETFRAGVGTITDATVGVLTVSGISTFNGETLFNENVTIDGDLTLTGTQNATQFGAQFLNITGVGTISDLRVNVGVITDLAVETFRAGVGTITDFVSTASTISFATIVDAGVGVASIGVADVNEAEIGITTVGYLNATDVNAGVATVGLLTATDVRITNDLTIDGNLNVTGDLSYDEVTGRNLNITGVGTIAQLGVSTFSATDAIIGVATVGFSTTAEAYIGFATVGFSTITEGYVGVATIGVATITDATITNDLTVEGNLNVTGDISYDEVTGRNLNITGVGTIRDFVSTAATIAYADIEDAEVGVASVGLASITTADVTTLTAYSLTVPDGGIVSLPGIPVLGGDAEFNNLSVGAALTVTGIATFQDDVRVEGDLFVSGIQINSSLGAEDLLVTGIATIKTGIVTELQVGVGTITDFVSAAATITEAGISTARVGFATVDAAYIGITSIGLAYIADLRGELIGAAVVDTDFAGIGIATVGFATIQDAEVGIATVGDVNIKRDLTVGGDVIIDGTVRIDGDIELNADINISGIATAESLDIKNGRIGVATMGIVGIETSLNVNGVGTIRDFVSAAATITYIDSTDVRVSGAATVVGDLSVEGNLNVTGDISYDEVSGRNLNISGVGTISQLGVSTFSATDATIGVATVAYVDATDLNVSTAATIAKLSSSDIDVNGDLAVTGNLEVSGDVSYEGLTGRNVVITGVGTIAQLGVNTFTAVGADIGIATVGYVNATDLNVGSAATIVDATITNDLTVDNNVAIGGTVGVAKTARFSQDIIVTGETVGFGSAFFGDILANDLDTDSITVGVVTATDITVSLAATVGVLSATDATITNDLTVKGNLNVTGDISYDEVSGRNLNISGVGTISQLGVTTFQAGLGTITDFVSTAATITTATIDDAIVDYVDAVDVRVTGITTFNKAAGIALTVTDLVVSGIATLNGAGIATEGGEVSFENIDVGIITATRGEFEYIDVIDANIGVATVGLASITTAGVGTITAFNGTFQQLTVPPGGIVSLPGIPVADGDASFRNLSIAGISSFLGVSTFRSDVYIEGTLFTSGDVVQDSVSADTATFGTVGINTGLSVAGYSTFAGASITGVTTITELADLNVSGVSTVGFVTARDVWVSGMITAQDVNSLSDRRVKENIRNIEKPLDKIDRINGVKFDFINSGKKSMGVIAQEVEQVFPELISGEFPKSVNYNGLIGLLIESVKELKQQNETMQAEIERLKNK